MPAACCSIIPAGRFSGIDIKILLFGVCPVLECFIAGKRFAELTVVDNAPCERNSDLRAGSPYLRVLIEQPYLKKMYCIIDCAAEFISEYPGGILAVGYHSGLRL